MQSQATTVAQYLAELPPERRAVIQELRKLLARHLDRDFEEGMQYGMIGYYVPHRVFPAGYHCDPKQPLPFAGLAAQKNHFSLYLMSMYGEGEHWKKFAAAWAKTGKKLDMGRCCLRFKKLEDLALEVIADAVAGISAREYVARYQAALAGTRAPRATPKRAPARRGGSAKKKPRARA